MATHLRRVSIVVADDHPIVLGGIVTLLSEDKVFKVVANCTDAEQAIDAIHTFKPDLALLDMNMPKQNGLQILNALVAENSPTRVIFLAASLTDREIVAATAAGAYGIVLKESAPDILIAALHAVAAGNKWLPSDLVDGATERLREDQAQNAALSRLLTPREMEIMLKVAEGLTNSQVGRQLSISEGTVKMHLHSIYQKVGVRNRTSLANYAIAYRERLAGD